jgi:hypothetical protein
LMNAALSRTSHSGSSRSRMCSSSSSLSSSLDSSLDSSLSSSSSSSASSAASSAACAPSTASAAGGAFSAAAGSAASAAAGATAAGSLASAIAAAIRRALPSARAWQRRAPCSRARTAGAHSQRAVPPSEPERAPAALSPAPQTAQANGRRATQEGSRRGACGVVPPSLALNSAHNVAALPSSACRHVRLLLAVPPACTNRCLSPPAVAALAAQLAAQRRSAWRLRSQPAPRWSSCRRRGCAKMGGEPRRCAAAAHHGRQHSALRRPKPCRRLHASLSPGPPPALPPGRAARRGRLRRV